MLISNKGLQRISFLSFTEMEHQLELLSNFMVEGLKCNSTIREFQLRNVRGIVIPHSLIAIYDEELLQKNGSLVRLKLPFGRPRKWRVVQRNIRMHKNVYETILCLENGFSRMIVPREIIQVIARMVHATLTDLRWNVGEQVHATKRQRNREIEGSILF